MLTRSFEEGGGAEDVGLEEGRRSGNGAVDMGLGGEMNDGLGTKVLEGGADGRGITDVGLGKVVGGVEIEVGKRLGAGRVGEFVEVQDFVAAGDEQANEIDADKAGTTGDEELHKKLKN